MLKFQTPSQSLETHRHTGGDIASKKDPLGRNQVNRYGSSEIDDQQITTRMQTCRSNRRCQPILSQRLWSSIRNAERNRRMGRESQTMAHTPSKQFGCLVGPTASRCHDRTGNGRILRQNIRQNHLIHRIDTSLGQQNTPVKHGVFDPTVTDIYCQMHLRKPTSPIQSDLRIRHASAISLTPLTVIARRLLCCLSTKRSGCCVILRKSSRKTSL